MDEKKFPCLSAGKEISEQDIDAMLSATPFQRGRVLMLPHLARWAVYAGWMKSFADTILSGGPNTVALRSLLGKPEEEVLVQVRQCWQGVLDSRASGADVEKAVRKLLDEVGVSELKSIYCKVVQVCKMQ